MKIVILGAGAMGSWFGGKLALAGHDVCLLTTNQAHRDAINNTGLFLQSEQGQQQMPVPALDPEEFSGPADIIMLFTKSFQSKTALTSIAASIDQNTHILSLQNGLGNVEIISQFVALEQIMVGVTMMPVDKLAPGIFKSTGAGSSYFNGVVDRESALSRELEIAFKQAGLDVRLDHDIHNRIWSKVAFNAGMNAVAAADGIMLDLAAIHDTIDFACKSHRDHKPSMHQDLRGARPTEVDALTGAIVAAGKRLGIPTPLNRILDTLVRLAELSHQRYYPVS